MGQNPIAYPLKEAFRMAGITRSRGFKAIKSGELQTYRDGKRRYATHKAIEAFVAQLVKASGTSASRA